MTSPAKADKSSVKNVLRTFVSPALRGLVGGGGQVRRAEVAFAAVQQVTIDIAVNAVAGQRQALISPEVKALIDGHQTQFGIYRTFLSGLIRQCEEIVKCGDGLAKHEFIQKTGHGKDAIAASKKLVGHLAKVHEVLNELLSLETKLPLVADAAGLAPFKAFDVRVQELIAEAKPLAEEVGAKFDEAVEFEAIKAIVVADPANTHAEIKGAFWVVEQGLNFMRFSGGLFGLIPSPFTTPVASGLNNASRALSILAALAKREMISRDNTAAVERYRDTHAAADKWKEHSDKPTLMAEMLATKRKADLQIALVCADAAVGPVMDLAGPIDFVWDVVRQGIQSTCEAYIDQRVENLKAQLGMPEEQVGAADVAKEFGKALYDQFKDNIFNALNPLNALKGAVLSMAGDKIAGMIMKRLPVDAAEPIDGAALKGEVDQLANAMIIGMPKRDDAFAAKMAAAEAAAAPPTVDKDGNAVEMVLSDVLVDDQKKSYRLVRIGGVPGALYLDGLEFKADKADSVTKTILSALPATDAKGRTVEQADLDLGFALGHPAPAGMTITGNHMWVRVGSLWGYIDTTTKTFWPADVDKSGFAKWADRRIKSDGYYEGGTHVKGKWYQPFPAHHSTYLLFDGANGFEWGRFGDATGNGKGDKYTLGNLVKAATGFDLTTL